MGMGQGVVTGVGHRASSVSYRHNFLVFIVFCIEILVNKKCRH